MKSKKRIIACSIAAILVALCIGGGTLAYFTDQETETNTFTVGDVDIELTETNWDEPDYVTPGVTYPKNPVVKNVGTNTAWVRVNVTLSDWAAFKTAAGKHNITDLTTIFNGYTDANWTLAGVKENSNDTVTYSYYFNSSLAKGETTGALFESVTVPAAFTSEDMASLGDDFTIRVTADAIQLEGFSTPAQAFAAFDAE